MAIPVLYWMLECTECKLRRVVRDSYLQFVGTDDPNPRRGAGYGGPALPERTSCANGCSGPMKAIASIFNPDDVEMWLHEPHVPVAMTKAQLHEWRQLIEAAGLPRERIFPKGVRKPWWRI
jgi:hypothetical protein